MLLNEEEITDINMNKYIKIVLISENKYIKLIFFQIKKILFL